MPPWQTECLQRFVEIVFLVAEKMTMGGHVQDPGRAAGFKARFQGSVVEPRFDTEQGGDAFTFYARARQAVETDMRTVQVARMTARPASSVARME